MNVLSRMRTLTTVAVTVVLLLSGSSAIAHEVEDLWGNVQEAGVLKVGAPVAPPYIIRHLDGSIIIRKGHQITL